MGKAEVEVFKKYSVTPPQKNTQKYNLREAEGPAEGP